MVESNHVGCHQSCIYSFDMAIVFANVCRWGATVTDFDHQLRNIGLRSVVIEQMKGAAISDSQVKRLKNELAQEKEKTKKAEQEAEYYKNLLSQPMHVIAANNRDFKKTYEIQQELLASWMVSQRAFKELAIEFGLPTGRTREEIINEGVTTVKEKVLNNQTKHKNNAETSELMSKYSERLKEKLKKT